MELLYKSVLCLKDEEECGRFFEDLCTIYELQVMTQRLHVVRLLRQGVTYGEIAAQTGASTATISRVNRSLNYGAQGYSAVMDRLENEAGSGE